MVLVLRLVLEWLHLRLHSTTYGTRAAAANARRHVTRVIDSGGAGHGRTDEEKGARRGRLVGLARCLYMFCRAGLRCLSRAGTGNAGLRTRHSLRGAAGVVPLVDIECSNGVVVVWRGAHVPVQHHALDAATTTIRTMTLGTTRRVERKAAADAGCANAAIASSSSPCTCTCTHVVLMLLMLLVMVVTHGSAEAAVKTAT